MRPTTKQAIIGAAYTVLVLAGFTLLMIAQFKDWIDFSGAGAPLSN